MHGSMSEGASLTGSIGKLVDGGIRRDGSSGGGGMRVGFTGLDAGGNSIETGGHKLSNGKSKTADNIRTRTIFGNWTELPPKSAGPGAGGWAGAGMGSRPGSPGSGRSSPNARLGSPNSAAGGGGGGFDQETGKTVPSGPSARDLSQVWQHMHPQLFNHLSDAQKKKLFRTYAEVRCWALACTRVRTVHSRIAHADMHGWIPTRTP